jgi:hypothetical protein
VFKELLARPEHDHEAEGEEPPEVDRKNGAPAHLPKIGDIKKGSRYSIPDLAVDVEQVMLWTTVPIMLCMLSKTYSLGTKRTETERYYLTLSNQKCLFLFFCCKTFSCGVA